MDELQQLYNGFFLNSTCANMQISNCLNYLRVAPIKIINKYEKLNIDMDNYAFAEKNAIWEFEYFHWLKNFIIIENSNYPPIFIFDNHNHALPFWYIISKNLKQTHKDSPILIHIDQHSDCWENKNHFKLIAEKDNLEEIFRFSNEKCNVGNFIPPALESGIILEQIQIRSLPALKSLSINKNKPFILDIDLDFCLDWIWKDTINKDNVNALKLKFDKFSKFASWITIATSPYFLDQNLAIVIIEKLLIE